MIEAEYVESQQTSTGLERDGSNERAAHHGAWDEANGKLDASPAVPLRQRMRLPLWARPLVRRALDRYPELPPSPQGLTARVALALVGVLALAFAVFFIVDQSLLHAAYATHAEDLGIMDQALWNSTNPHGQFLHQTICDPIGDTNCLGDVARTAIHFEPILLLVAPIYAAFASPLTLLVIQAVVVAAGAFPAYWIAARRLRSPLAGVAFAAIYLAFPALQSAVASDFHAVTLSAAFVMFALYFMLARNDLGLWIACILAMATKEEVPLLVIMIGLSVALLQRRWRLGFGLAGVALAYLGLAELVIHFSSPLGYSSTTPRFAYLTHTPPLTILRHYLLARTRIDYLRKLLSPTAYLAVLSPLTLLIAAPELAINMLSTVALMHSGNFQYNADIVPVIVLASIESTALLSTALIWVAGYTVAPAWRRFALTPRGASLPAWAKRLPTLPFPRIIIGAAILLALGGSFHEVRRSGDTPLTWGFHWPRITAHARLANSFVAMIPPDASVSAQSDLVPHLSQRRFIYMFPDHAADADYVLLDVTGNIFPLQNTPGVYQARVQELLAHSAYHIAAARDGYLLFKRGPGTSPTALSGNPYGLPASFYSFTQPSTAPPHALAVRFGSSLELVGYDVWPDRDINLNVTTLQVATYWRVTGPIPAGTAPAIVLLQPGGGSTRVTDLPATQWLPADRWPLGATIVVRTRPLSPATGPGTLRVGAEVTSPPAGMALPVTIEKPASPGQPYPRTDVAGVVALFADAQVLP
ncbi:MAG: hypothetical protein PVSMB4_04100 [Ktedonobacterales bacterium]